MDRKGLLASILVALAISQPANAQTSLVGKRVFTLWEYETASVLQSATISHDQMCFLKVNRQTRQSQVGAVDGNGQIRFRFPRSGGQYYFLGIRPSGSLLLQRLGSRLEEVSEKGEKTGEWPDSEQGARQCLTGDTLVRILQSGTMEFIPLGAPSNRRTAAAPKALASGGYAMEAISDNTVIAIERASAHMVRIEVDAARFTEYQPVSDELRSSAAYYEKRRSESGDSARKLNTISVLATGADKSGNLLAMVSPYTVAEAVVLRLDASGRVLGRVYLSLPDRRNPSYGIPGRLGMLGDSMCVLFLQGGVVCY
jgi:hypothetical protein